MVPSQSIVQGLAYINWGVLVALAVGSFAFVALAGELTDATRGYLGFTAFCAGLLALIALLADLGLPEPRGLALADGAAFDPFRRAALAALVVGAFGYVFAVGRSRRRRPWGVLGMGAALAVIALAAFGWSSDLAAGVPFLVQLAVLAGAAGGSLATLILGHWYLVTPRLSEQPLLLLARLLRAVVALQLALFVVWVAIGTDPIPTPFTALSGPSALLVWLRLLVGIIFPLVLSWMAVRTAATRSMESATGLLYLALAAIASGTIVSMALAVGSGLLV